MNDTMNATDPGGALPPPYLPPTEPRPPLRRSRDDRVVAGVAGGLGRTFGVDPVIFRVVLVALAVIGGSGLVLYGLLWLLVPEDGSDGSSVADRWVRSRAWSTATVILLALAAAVILSIVVGLDPGPLVLLAVLGVVALVLTRRESRAPATPVSYGPGTPYGPSPAPSPGAYAAPTYATQPYAAPTYATQPYAPYGGPPPTTPPLQAQPVPPSPPKPPRERSALGVLTLGLAALTAGVLVAVRMVNDTGAPTTTAILAATTLTLGLGLLVGTFVGRARWLVIPGVLLLMATATSGVVARFDGFNGFDGPRGSRTFTPQTSEQVLPTYEWGAGEVVLDLTQVAGDPDLTVAFDLGAGSLTVLVPRDAAITGTAEAGLGTVQVDGVDGVDGVGLTVDLTDSPDGASASQTINLDLTVGIGEVVVNRA